jgi:hypothetical protein
MAVLLNSRTSKAVTLGRYIFTFLIFYKKFHTTSIKKSASRPLLDQHKMLSRRAYPTDKNKGGTQTN